MPGNVGLGGSASCAVGLEATQSHPSYKGRAF